MLDEIFDRFEGAFAEGTIRAYKSDFAQFNGWCIENDLSPFDITASAMANYIEWLEKDFASSSIRRRLHCISTVLKLSGHPDPTREPDVLLAMKRMHRRKGRAQRQAIPLTRNVLVKLLAICGTDNRGMRDRVMLMLGYETMRRRAELCRFRFEDIVVLPNGRTGLRLTFSKTDQFGRGKLIPISQELYSTLDAWGERFGSSGYLLRGVHRLGNIGVKLHPASINRRLHQLQQEAQLDLGGCLSGHSFRVGAALDLLDEGVPLEKIMLRGGWHAESTVIRYLREWQAI